MCTHFGIRSGLKEEFQWAKENGMHISKFEVLEPLKEVLPTLAGRPVYVTIDIDVLDPAHAPGTGTVDCWWYYIKRTFSIDSCDCWF